MIEVRSGLNGKVLATFPTWRECDSNITSIMHRSIERAAILRHPQHKRGMVYEYGDKRFSCIEKRGH